MGVRRAVTIDGAHVSKLVGNVDRDVASYTCRCTNCENVPSPRSTSETAESEVEQELHDDHSLRNEYNSELVDYTPRVRK